MYADQNPFRTAKIHQLGYQFSEPSFQLSELVARLKEHLQTGPAHLALVGGHGCGKTTLLTTLQAQMTLEGWSTLRFSAARSGEGDSAVTKSALRPNLDTQRLGQSIPRIHWVDSPILNEIKSAIQGQATDRLILFLDSGENLRGIAWWRFRWVTRRINVLTTLHHWGRLETLYHCQSDEQVFLEQCRLLMQDTPVEQTFPTQDLLQVYHECQGNMREAFFRLYEKCSRLKDIRKE